MPGVHIDLLSTHSRRLPFALPDARRSCKAEQLVMIGDRYLTDVVFGNRSGMLTIRPVRAGLHFFTPSVF